MFRCVDLEGGTVDRLRDAVAHAPSLGEVAATGSKKIVRRFARLLAEEARALGFNTDFAPVFDLQTPESLKVLTSRTIAGDPQRVIEFAREFLKGFERGARARLRKAFPWPRRGSSRFAPRTADHP